MFVTAAELRSQMPASTEGGIKIAEDLAKYVNEKYGKENMNKVSESIWSDGEIVIPMADVQHIEKKFHSCDLASGTKKGDLSGSMVITKHTRWDMEADTWANNIWLSKEQTERFLKDWCFYRHELEGGKEAFLGAI